MSQVIVFICKVTYRDRVSTIVPPDLQQRDNHLMDFISTENSVTVDIKYFKTN